MGERFPSDPDARSKLAVAKDCIARISEQLLPTDRLSLVSFADIPTTCMGLHFLTPVVRSEFNQKLEMLIASNRTELGLGLERGFAPAIRELPLWRRSPSSDHLHIAILQRLCSLHLSFPATSSDP